MAENKQLALVKAFRVSTSGSKKKPCTPILVRKGSLLRTRKSKNLKSSLGRSQKVKDLHLLLRKESVIITKRSEQKSIVQDLLLGENKRMGEEYFLLDAEWFGKWNRYVASEEEKPGDSPGPIDNSRLLLEGRLKEDLSESEYTLVPKSVWKKLQAWYGGGPPISRKMIVRGSYVQHLYVDLFPLRIRMMKIETEEIRSFDFCSTSTVKDIRRIVASNWAAPLLKCKLFRHTEELTTDENLQKTLQELQLFDNQIILMKSTDRHFGLSGKIMGLTNVQDKVPRIMYKAIEAAPVKKMPIMETVTVKLPEKRGNLTEKAKLQQIAKEIMLTTPVDSIRSPVTAC